MSRASIYYRGDDVYVVSSARDVHGIHRDGEWRVKLARTISAHDLGEAVLAAFAAYRTDAPARLYVRGTKSPPDAFLLFAGFKSWKAFEKGATYFMLSAIESGIEITPTTAGAKGGYLHHPEQAIRCSREADDIGTCLHRQARPTSAPPPS